MTASLLAVFVALCSRALHAQVGQGSCEINDFNEVSLLQGLISHDAEPLLLGEAADAPLPIGSVANDRGNTGLATYTPVSAQGKQDHQPASQPASQPAREPARQPAVVYEGEARQVSTSEHLVAWLHIPKCGTSFGTTLAHYANSSLPPDAKLPTPERMDRGMHHVGLPAKYRQGSPGAAFNVIYPVDTWFKGLFWNKGGPRGQGWWGHAEITADVYEKWRGHLFGMFRSPAKRMHSAWNHFGSKYDLATFFKQQKGLATKMVAGQENGGTGFTEQELNISLSNAVVPDLQLALERLDGFKFIGLTDYWNTSICLFHVMFGGQVTHKELENIRPGNYSQPNQSQQEEESFFNSHVDPYDSGLYEKASAIFWANVKQYKVNEAECARTE